MKKQVVLLTDYIPINVTDAMNTITNVGITRGFVRVVGPTLQALRLGERAEAWNFS